MMETNRLSVGPNDTPKVTAYQYRLRKSTYGPSVMMAP